MFGKYGSLWGWGEDHVTICYNRIYMELTVHAAAVSQDLISGYMDISVHRITVAYAIHMDKLAKEEEDKCLPILARLMENRK